MHYLNIQNIPPPLRLRREYAHNQYGNAVLGYIRGYENMPDIQTIRRGFPDVYRLNLEDGEKLHELSADEYRRFREIQNRFNHI